MEKSAAPQTRGSKVEFFRYLLLWVGFCFLFFSHDRLLERSMVLSGIGVFVLWALNWPSSAANEWRGRLPLHLPGIVLGSARIAMADDFDRGIGEGIVAVIFVGPLLFLLAALAAEFARSTQPTGEADGAEGGAILAACTLALWWLWELWRSDRA